MMKRVNWFMILFCLKFRFRDFVAIVIVNEFNHCILVLFKLQRENSMVKFIAIRISNTWKIPVQSSSVVTLLKFVTVSFKMHF